MNRIVRQIIGVMNMRIPPIAMFIFGLVIFALIILLRGLITNSDPATAAFTAWVFRIIIALAASMVSMAIPGSVTIGGSKAGEDPKRTLAEEAPKIAATGAIAVFVLVYLFDPITFSAS